MESFIKFTVPLTEKQTELDDSLNNFNITGYGGAKGGGKSHGARSVQLLRLLTKHGHVGAIFRRTYSELNDNHIDPLFKQFPELRPYYNSGKKEIRIPELESELKFRYCERQGDVDRYAGREIHTIAIDECGDWTLEMALSLIRNCNRSTVPGIKASAMLAFNWGGIGHGGLKRVFYTKDLRAHEKNLTFNFILAKVEDNPAILENDPGYLLRLDSEPNEALRRAYRHGDPDIVAGQYFEILREVHVIKPIAIPNYWTWFGAYDYGFNHPCSWGLFAVDADGRVFMVWELVRSRLGLAEQAEIVHQAMVSRNIDPGQVIFQAGLDCWAKKKGSEPTIAEDFVDPKVVGRNEIILARANINRMLGAHRVREYLKYKKLEDNRHLGPNFVLFETCTNTIECLTRMIHDPDKVEDVLKVDSVNGDASTGDDPYDMVRYGLMSRPSLQAPELPKHKVGTTEWKEMQAKQIEEEAEERFRLQQEEKEELGVGIEKEY